MAERPAERVSVGWPVAAVVSAALLLTVVLAKQPASAGLRCLQYVFAILALFEGRNAYLLTFRARDALPQASYVYHPGGHGLHQELGVYGWALAATFALAALDPLRHALACVLALAMELPAALMHLLRARGISLGGAPLYRPARVERAEGLYHLACGLAVAAVAPWSGIV